MTDKFLGSTSTEEISNGTTTVFGATIGASNLNASETVKTDSLKRLISTKLLISDTTNLQTTLDALGDVWSRNDPNVAFKNAGDKMAVDTFRSENGTDDIVFENTINVTNIETNTITTKDSTGVTIAGVLFHDNRISAIDDTFPILNFERTTSGTGGALTTLDGVSSTSNCITSSDTDISAGFGGGFLFSIEGANQSEIFLSRLYSRVESGTNVGCVQLWNHNGSSHVITSHHGIDNHIWYLTNGTEYMNLSASDLEILTNLKVDSITESSLNNGVDVETVHFEDGNISTSGNITADIATIETLNIDHDTRPNLEIYDTSVDGYPMLTMMNENAHGTSSLAFDSYNSTGTWKSSNSVSNYRLVHDNTVLRIQGNSGTNQGTDITWKNVWYWGADSLVKHEGTIPQYSINQNSDIYPEICMYSVSHNDCALLFNAYYSGGDKSSSNDSSFKIHKDSDSIDIRYGTAVTGTVISWNTSFWCSDSGQVGIPACFGDTCSGGTTLFIRSNGQLGTNTSLEESKANIIDLPDSDWIYSLSPIQFNYRKEEGEGWSDTKYYPEVEYGFLARAVKDLNPNMVYYKEKRTHNEKCESTTHYDEKCICDKENQLRGIKYLNLIPILVKKIIEHKTLIDQLQTQLNTEVKKTDLQQALLDNMLARISALEAS